MTMQQATLYVGQKATRTNRVREKDIQSYAELSGDMNPVHLNEAYAETTRFKGRIAHGMLSAGFISATLGNDLPGLGTIYLGQTLKFKAPVRPGDLLTTTVEILSIREDKPIVTLRTQCHNQDGILVIDGEATVSVADLIAYS